MLRSLPFILLSPILVAAPVPPDDDAARIRRTFGSPYDPDHQFRFTMEKNALRIAVPALKVDQIDGPNLPRSARVWREVEGDFTVAVRATIAGKANDGVAAIEGLVVFADFGEHIVLGRELLFNNGTTHEIIHLVYSYDGTTRRAHNESREPREAAFLRMKREGTQVSTAFSRDGKEWTEFFADGIDWKGALKVGVYAKNLKGEAFTAVFDQYALMQTKK